MGNKGFLGKAAEMHQTVDELYPSEVPARIQQFLNYVSPVKIEEVNGKRCIVHIGKPSASSAIDMEPKK